MPICKNFGAPSLVRRFGSRRFRPHTVSVLLFCLISVSAISFLVWHSLRQNAKFVVYSPSARSAALDGENPFLILQEVICPNGADHCFKVEDLVHNEWQPNGTKWRRYQRMLMDESEANVVFSIADLMPDDPDTPFSAQNALRWTVRKNNLPLPYMKAIAAQMFVSGCARLEPSGRTRRTLMVGLGGASVPNFLLETDPSHEVVSVELEPAVEYIARKWFGLEQSPRQKVVVRDGVEFIREWAENDGRFDCVVVDACKISAIPPSQKYPLLCPFFEAFVDYDKMADKFVKMLHSNGTLMVNFFVRPDINNSMVAEGRQFLLDLFRRHFGGEHFCYYIAVNSFSANKLLVCSLALSSAEPMTEKLFDYRLNKLPKWLQDELRTEMSIENEMWKKKPKAI
ncbi:hypothetical protein niasHT_028866 [Heterodera trifolii]|uniref:Methyltransferase-like protein 13 n=1 Tax=Heterodera trifolii TaxID=157864 RepID=A0ABD2KQI0_9BILA